MPPSTKEDSVHPYFRKIARFGLELLKKRRKQGTIQGKKRYGQFKDTLNQRGELSVEII